jgi:hypothetical protein
MKQIKLTGRERTVLRHIDFATGTPGDELLERTRLEPDDLVSTINGLLQVGYAEIEPYAEQTDEASFRQKLFGVNPSYALQLREAMSRL